MLDPLSLRSTVPNESPHPHLLQWKAQLKSRGHIRSAPHFPNLCHHFGDMKRDFHHTWYTWINETWHGDTRPTWFVQLSVWHLWVLSTGIQGCNSTHVDWKCLKALNKLHGKSPICFNGQSLIIYKWIIVHFFYDWLPEGICFAWFSGIPDHGDVSARTERHTAQDLSGMPSSSANSQARASWQAWSVQASHTGSD